MKPVTIDYQLLEDHDICEDVLDVLMNIYGESGTFNTPQELANAITYIRTPGLDNDIDKVDWCYRKLLNQKYQKQYYILLGAPLKRYINAIQPQLDIHSKNGMIEAYETYEKAIEPLWNIFQSDMALIFATLYFEQENNT